MQLIQQTLQIEIIFNMGAPIVVTDTTVSFTVTAGGTTTITNKVDVTGILLLNDSNGFLLGTPPNMTVE